MTRLVWVALIVVLVVAAPGAHAANSDDVRTGRDLATICSSASQAVLCEASVRRELGDTLGYGKCLRGVSKEALRRAVVKTATAHSEVLDDIAWVLAVYTLEETFCSREDTAFVDKAIRALGEPPLAEPPNSTLEVYRLVALPTFHLPVAIRVTILPSGEAAATVRRSTRPRGHKGPLALDRAIAVSREDVQALRDAVERTKFWTLLLTERRVSPATRIVVVPICADGTSNIVEVVQNGRYHRVDRGCRLSPEFASLIDVFKRIGRPLLPGLDDYVP